MAINRTSAVRSDFPFLTRRVKPAAASAPAPAARSAVQAPAPAQAPKAAAPPSSSPRSGSFSLSLSVSREATPLPASQQPPPARADTGSAPAPSLSLGLSPAARASAARGATAPRTAGPTRSAGPARTANPAARLFPAPAIDEVRALDEKAPLVRLSPLQSAIGSLLVTGTRAVVWEASDLTTGARTADGAAPGITGTEVQTAGNRPLLDYVEKVAVVPLRHIGELRRALFIPQPGTTMLVEIYDGGSFAVPFETSDPAGSARPLVQVLSLLRVGNQVELRAEPVPAGLELRGIWAEFGFTMTESVAASLRRN